MNANQNMAKTQAQFLFFSTLILFSISTTRYVSLVSAVRHGTPNVFSLPLYHRSSIPGSRQNPTLKISQLKNGQARIDHIKSRINSAISHIDDMIKRRHHPHRVHTPVATIDGGLEYAARVTVGKPAKEFYLLADTGFDNIWLQCKPCVRCYNQIHPIFDPSMSSTYRRLSCDSEPCRALGRGLDCSPQAGSESNCTYSFIFGGSGGFNSIFSKGEYATETLSFGQSGHFKNVSIGCGHENQGFNEFDGIIGLGLGELSFPDQIKARSFSYCLVDPQSNSSSTLQFNPAMPHDSVVTPLVKSNNKDLVHLYFLELTAITVGEQKIQIPETIYRSQPNGKGGFVFDSGTTITSLASSVYNPVRDAFRQHTSHLPKPKNMTINVPFDTCYAVPSQNLSGIQLPAMSFHFQGAAREVVLRRENFLIPIDVPPELSDGENVYCFAFLPAEGELSVIGNVQQQRMRITFDLQKKLIGFSPNNC